MLLVQVNLKLLEPFPMQVAYLFWAKDLKIVQLFLSLLCINSPRPVGRPARAWPMGKPSELLWNYFRSRHHKLRHQKGSIQNHVTKFLSMASLVGWCIISAILVSSYLTQIFGNPANIREAFSFIVSTTVLFSKCTFAACFLSLENNIIFQFMVFRYRGYHIGLYNLVIGWLTLECDIWFWFQPH